MARFSGITYDLLGPQTQPAMRAHSILCFHTMAGSFAGTDSMFHANGFKGTESHVGVRADGFGKGWQEPSHTADANLDGNGEVISVETEDYGGAFGKWNTSDPSQIPAWTDAQIARNIDLGVQACLPGTDPRSIHRDCPKSWTCYQQGIPAVLIPDTRPGRRGIGYHRQGIDPWRVADGVHWSTSRGKPCPGERRIAQLKAVVIPGIQAGLKHPTQEEDMPTADEIAKAVWDHQVARPGNTPISAGSHLGSANVMAYRANVGVQGLTAQIGALQAAVAALSKGGTLTAAEITQAAQAGADAALAELGKKLGGA